MRTRYGHKAPLLDSTLMPYFNSPKKKVLGTGTRHLRFLCFHAVFEELSTRCAPKLRVPEKTEGSALRQPKKKGLTLGVIMRKPCGAECSYGVTGYNKQKHALGAGGTHQLVRRNNSVQRAALRALLRTQTMWVCNDTVLCITTAQSRAGCH